MSEPTDRAAELVPGPVRALGNAMVRAETAEAEVERLRATIARVEALAEQWAEKPYPSTASAGWNNGYDMAIEEAEDALRTALRGSEPTDVGEAIRAENAESEVARLRAVVDSDYLFKTRAEKAEAAIARVEAMATAWETPPVRINSIRSEVIAHHLREALRDPEPTD